MYSKVKIFGRAIHPILVMFPITFYLATFVCSVVYVLNSNAEWFRISYYACVAGVMSALIAALAGFFDWQGIPAGNRAKRVGLMHMVLNVFSLLLFGANILIQQTQLELSDPNPSWAVLLSGAGVLLTGIACILGSSLVQKYHVGIDISPHLRKFETIE